MKEPSEAWRIVQRQESWHVLDRGGVLLVAFPTKAEGQAWVAGVRYGIDRCLATFREGSEDVRNRLDGVAMAVERVRTDTAGVGQGVR